MRTRINFTVSPEYDGKTLKVFLRSGCGVSASLLTQLKLEENGIANGGAHAIATDILHTGDNITITLPMDKNEIAPVKLPISILYEDEHIIIFDKQPHMAVHPVHGHLDDTLANAASYYSQKQGENYTFRAVNRLDRDTSGALLAAKNSYAASLLPKTAKKKYIAVCEGIIEHGGTVNAPIRLKEGHTIQREVGEGGVSAITHYKPIQSCGGHTLVEFELETGRTHQIRVHMSHLGYPLAGDDMYGGSREFISRQALHCAEIDFIHPITHEQMKIKSPLPDDMKRLINIL